MGERRAAQAMRLRGVDDRHERVAGEYAGDGVHRSQGVLAGGGDIAADAAEGFGTFFAAGKRSGRPTKQTTVRLDGHANRPENLTNLIRKSAVTIMLGETERGMQ